jgi:uncharacterized protein DUF3850
MQHVLKCWPEFFRLVKIGDKTADLRKDDRNYRVGDTIFNREYDPKLDQYTGHTCLVTITAVLRDFEGLMPGYCVLSTKLSPDSCRFQVALVGKTAKQLEEEEKQK